MDTNIKDTNIFSKINTNTNKIQIQINIHNEKSYNNGKN